eukprot:TRINITY_DN18205_c0_g1_i1.p1 TRINITY_DN18205_c0_g1~~TRINITY_DN18205_c0_g1_i1.p1  ORF type:complete len:195 (-),score=24.28 TRINITY_DN18205_c0_g1_i1:77-661(-)
MLLRLFSAFRHCVPAARSVGCGTAAGAPVSVFDRAAPTSRRDAEGAGPIRHRKLREAPAVDEFPGRGDRRRSPSQNYGHPWNSGYATHGINTERLPFSKRERFELYEAEESAPSGGRDAPSTPHSRARSRRQRRGSLTIPAGGIVASSGGGGGGSGSGGGSGGPGRGRGGRGTDMGSIYDERNAAFSNLDGGRR